MTEDSEQTMMVDLKLSDFEQNSQTEKYTDLNNSIKTINRMGPYGNAVLHVASCQGHSEVIQVLFTNNALQSFKNMPYQLSSNGESRIDEIRELFLKNANLFSPHIETQDYDYIEWSSIGTILIKKRQEFREQIDLYKTYDNQSHFVTKLLFEIIEYYLNEYLVEQEHFSKDVTEKLEFCFQQAIQEKSYLKYFIKAYTLTNNFHHVLNKHLALYVLDYFDASPYASSPTKYRLINCLVHIVTLLINHPDIHKYKYNGTTYRGLLMTENDLKRYSVGNHILNKSFVSTSKNRSVAQIFAGNGQQNSANISVLLKYTTKQNQTAIDIEHLSTIKDEKEVLILPFSVFQIKDRIEHNRKMSPPVLVEIDLEECEDDELINDKKQKNTPFTNLEYQTRRRRRKKKTIARSKCLYGSIGSFIIFSLILGVGLYMMAKPNNEIGNEEQKVIIKGTCPLIVNRSVWNATKPKNNYTKLSIPVPHVAIHHTTGAQCTTLHSCISEVQHWQNFHMITKEWDDIGYNFLVGGNGYIFEGRGWNHTGAHCKGFNPISIGIGIIGDLISVRPSKSSLDAVESLIKCGVSFGFIQENYTLIGHEGFGIPESYMFNVGTSHRVAHYCLRPTTTVAPQ